MKSCMLFVHIKHKKESMLKLTYLIILFLLGTLTVFAQPGRSYVLGKIVAKSRDLEEVYVQNKNTGKYTVTERGGYFNIQAQPEDTLVFAGTNLKGREKVLTYADMNKTMVFVPMEITTYMLDEMIIDKRITARSLGLPTGRTMTPAERRLHTATSHPGGMGMTFGIDGLINALSGRTKMLKKALAYEKEELLAARIINRFERTFYTEDLKIPDIYVDAFGYFLMQDLAVIESLDETKNMDRVKFLYTEKVPEFLELVKVLQ